MNVRDIRRITALAIFAMLASVTGAPAEEKFAPTFSKDIAPILQRSCQRCHRPNSIAPMSLLTYEDARPWTRSIRNKVAAREMPPWFIDKTVGIKKFKNDVSLPEKEIATILAWVDNGAPRGNPADLPPSRQFADDDAWQLGTRDLIVTLPKDIVVPAGAPDRWVDVLVPSGLTEDRYLRAVETKALKGMPVIHHVRTDMFDPNHPDPFMGTPGGEFLNEYAPGKDADVFPEGTARLIKAGTLLNFNMHLHSVGKETAANVGVALSFYPKGFLPQRVTTTIPVGGQSDLDIPPNTDNVRADGYTVLFKPVRLLSFQPHMHNRGKGMCLEAIIPPAGPDTSGLNRTTAAGRPRVETISCTSRFNFAWHMVYLYDDAVQPILPAGTVLHVIGYHNNTAAHRSNPDPDNLITNGQRTIDDMSSSWVSWIELTNEEYAQAVKAAPQMSQRGRP